MTKLVKLWNYSGEELFLNPHAVVAVLPTQRLTLEPATDVLTTTGVVYTVKGDLHNTVGLLQKGNAR